MIKRSLTAIIGLPFVLLILIFGNKYIISQEYQVLPLYKFTIKRNEYYVLHFDPEFKKKKEYLKKLQNIQKDQNLLNMNIYFECSIEAALKFILKRRYNMHRLADVRIPLLFLSSY